MAKKKVHEVAKEFEVQSKDIIGFFAEQGIDKKAGSNVEDQEYDMVKSRFAKSSGSPKAETEKQDTKEKAESVVLRPVSVDGRPVSSDGRRVVTGADNRKNPQDVKRPMPADGRRPMPADGRRPMPADGRRPMPADGRRPMPADGRRPMPADGRRPMPADGRRPMPADGRRPMPADGRRPMPADGRRPAQAVQPTMSKAKNDVDKVEIPKDKKPSSSYRFGQPAPAPVQPRPAQSPVQTTVKPEAEPQPEVKEVEKKNEFILDEKKTVTLNKMGNVFDNMKKQEAARAERAERNRAEQSSERRSNFNGERRPYQGNNQQNGERRPYNGQGGQGRPFERNQNGERRSFGNNQGGFGDRRGGGMGFNKDAFDKDKDAPSFPPRSRSQKPSDKGGIKASDLGKDPSKQQRAAAFNDRNRDKNRNNRDMMDMEDMDKLSKKKDPNRKGAFIMPKPVAKPEVEEDEIKSIVIPDTITIKELADKLKKAPAVIIKKLFLEGKIVSQNQEITYEEAEEIALGYDCLCEHEEKVDIVAELMKDEEDPEDSLVKRPPVVCVMGHVDHGKTSLLDAIRKTNVTAREAGGITQHIGAYMVEINGEKITFLDTPGHEAFTSMRMRGAKSTDIAILVVAADDGVMPQTVEAINHAKAAGIQIIVAVNKIDKPSANVERVKQELTEHGLVAEDWGGDTIFAPVSAKTGDGIEQLLEMVLLTAEMGELKANPNRRARGIVIEAELDKGRGPVATILVQKGTLHVGDNIVIGSAYGKVRAMIDDKARRVKEAKPSVPVEILGLNEVPGAGDIFVATKDDKEARNIANAFIAQGKERLIADTKSKLSLDGLFSQIKAGNIKELNLIIKADVQGSVEAMKQSLVKLSNEEVAVRVIHGGVGAINESDVNLASASNAIIIGFNVKPDNTAKDIAEHEKVDVKLYRVIYNAIEDIEAAMKGMLDPIFEEKVIAHAEIRQVFKASGLGSIAGSFVLDGKVQRNSKARITRDGEQIFDGPVASLKRMKDDVKEVAAGYECGIVFEKFNDLQELDQIEFYMMVEVPR